MKTASWLLHWTRSHNTSVPDTKIPIQEAPRIIFRPMYKKDEIGTLEFSNKSWTFIYSDWFKNQSGIQPFANFPDVNREYVSEELPPFFESRLPGITQPQVEAFLRNQKNEQINEVETKVALLKKFGRLSITNPFELQPAF